jgi:hypothetical protein
MADVSWQEAIRKVLRGAVDPLHYTEIASRVSEQGHRKILGATPAQTVGATLSSSIKKKGEKSPFERVGIGLYRLRPKTTGTLTATTGVEPKQEEEEEEEPETGLINAFGMYWQRDDVLWEKPQLLGQQQPGSTAVNFGEERGVYLLHDGREVIYVGRTTDQPLWKRLRDHTTDRLRGRWDRFSWFGILPVKNDGELADSPSETFDVENLIATMEALLIEGLEPRQNRRRGDGFSAVEFIQVVDPEIERRKDREVAERLLKGKM